MVFVFAVALYHRRGLSLPGSLLGVITPAPPSLDHMSLKNLSSSPSSSKSSPSSSSFSSSASSSSFSSFSSSSSPSSPVSSFSSCSVPSLSQSPFQHNLTICCIRSFALIAPRRSGDDLLCLGGGLCLTRVVAMAAGSAAPCPRMLAETGECPHESSSEELEVDTWEDVVQENHDQHIGDWSQPDQQNTKKEPPNFGLLTGNWGYLTEDTNQTLFTHQVKDILESPAPLLLIQEASRTVLEHVKNG